MKPKQLANVLVRVLGLSLCAHAVPGVIVAVVNGAAQLIQAMHDGGGYGHNSNLTLTLAYWLSSFAEFAIGLFLIFRSRLAVEKLFKDERE